MTETSEQAQTPVRRRGGWQKGRPRRPLMAATPQVAPVPKQPTLPKMRAKPNWLDMVEGAETVDRLHIPSNMIPAGMDMMWVTEAVWGQPMPQVRSNYEKGGWTPVYADDFSGQFDGYFTPKGDQGEIKVDGLVLMARPIELTIRARARQRQESLDPLRKTKNAIISGDIPGVTGADHPAARAQNKIASEFGPGYIPDKPLTYSDE